MSATRNILVIGASDTGKTHYGVQLLGRLRHRQDGALLLDSPVEDLTMFEEGLSALENGQPAEHTASKTHGAVRLSLRNTGDQRLELLWPEYGGEQIKDILNQRGVGNTWHERLKEADLWMLFIRPSLIRSFGQDPSDIVARLESHASNTEERPQEIPAWTRWDDNAKYVELLQILLYMSQRSTLHPLQTPQLAVMLSCIDELPEAAQRCRPVDILRQRLPLLASFIESNWQRGACAVWGLSALGRALPKGQTDEEFAVAGPERFGYVIDADGQKSADLTLPLHWLMRAAS